MTLSDFVSWMHHAARLQEKMDEQYREMSREHGRTSRHR